MKNKKVNNITFVIHPTSYQDYDILAIGSFHLLEQLSHQNEYYHFIKKSKFGKIPILIIDTCDTMREAVGCIKHYNELYKNTINVE
jgi:hypothetical protein